MDLSLPLSLSLALSLSLPPIKQVNMGDFAQFGSLWELIRMNWDLKGYHPVVDDVPRESHWEIRLPQALSAFLDTQHHAPIPTTKPKWGLELVAGEMAQS